MSLVTVATCCIKPLNNLALLHVYQERVDNIDNDTVATEFVTGVDVRLKCFETGK